MRIATYNMRQGGTRQLHWLRLLDDVAPDVLLAQETLSPEEPPLLHGDLHRRAVWAPVPDRPWGSAVFASGGRISPIATPDFIGSVVGAEVVGDDGRLMRVFSIHAPKRGDYRTAVNAILDMLAGFRNGGEMLIGGDFNLTIGERQASEAETTCAEDMAIQRRLRDEFGLINCWQSANPGLPLPQTLRWQKNPAIPYHCDGIFVPAGWGNRVNSCRVLSGEDWTKISDHNPVVATFDAEAGAGT